jgi:hypothetical protein
VPENAKKSSLNAYFRHSQVKGIRSFTKEGWQWMNSINYR